MASASTSAGAASWDSSPSAEWLLQQVDAAGSSGVEDSRKLVSLPPSPSNLDDVAQVEAYYKSRADWQLALQGHLKSLEAREMIAFKSQEETYYTLTKEGSQMAKAGSPEYRLWQVLPQGGEEGKTLDQLKAELGADTLKIAQGKAFAKKWARKHPTEAGALARTPGTDNVEDETAEDLRKIRDEGSTQESRIADLKKRKLVNQK